MNTYADVYYNNRATNMLYDRKKQNEVLVVSGAWFC